MTSSESAVRPVVRPRIERIPDAAFPGAAEALELADRCGLGLMPWQEWALAAFLGERADGRWATRQVGLLVPRQNGKSYLVAARVLAGLVLFGERLITYTAHEFKTALEVFMLVDGAMSSTRATRRLMRPTRWSHGEETVQLTSGQRFKVLARTSASGRGFSGDCVFLDEALEIRDEAPVRALLPTMSARPNPQLWTLSSAGDAGSVWLGKVRDRGVRGDPGLAYLEWSADVDDDVADPAVWAAANPGLEYGRPDPEAVAEEFASLSAEGFGQERLGVWAGQTKEALIPPLAWQATRTARVPDPTPGDVRVVYEVEPDRSSACILACWRAPDGRPHARLVRWAPGDAWLPDALAQLARGWDVPIHYDDSGPARDIASLLAAAGTPIERLNSRDRSAASAMLLSSVVNKATTHHPDDALDASAAGATARKVGEGWSINRRGPVPAGPVMAYALALWALVNNPTPAPFEIL